MKAIALAFVVLMSVGMGWNKCFYTDAEKYQLGWPAGGTSEPDVLWHLLFDQVNPEDNLVDSITGTEFKPIDLGEYSCSDGSKILLNDSLTERDLITNHGANGRYKDLGPMTRFPTGRFSTKSGFYASEGGALPAWDIGTSDWTLEVWYRIPPGITFADPIHLLGAGDEFTDPQPGWEAGKGYSVKLTGDKILVTMGRQDSGITFYQDWWSDTETDLVEPSIDFKKLRIVADRDDKLYFYLNEQLISSTDIYWAANAYIPAWGIRASSPGDDDPVDCIYYGRGVTIGSSVAGGGPVDILEMRMSLNAKNNSTPNF